MHKTVETMHNDYNLFCDNESAPDIPNNSGRDDGSDCSPYEQNQ